MHHNDASKMTPPPIHPDMRHTQSFDKTNSFLKPVLSILIVCNLIVGWELFKRGLVFCIKAIDLDEVFKSWGEYDLSSTFWYYLGPFQTFKAEPFAKNFFG